MRGKLLSFSLFGESHGKAVGVLVEGLPPGIEVSVEELKRELERRKGIERFATKRKETDEPKILSGVSGGGQLGHLSPSSWRTGTWIPRTTRR